MKNTSKISLKKVSFSDIEFLWYLRNQPDVYRYARQNRTVKWEEHIKWIIPILLGIVPKSLFIIQKKSLPIGQIRFDCQKNGSAEISIAVLKEFRGGGVGTKSFKKAIKLFEKEREVKDIIAKVHKNNIPSQKFFEKLSFKLKEKRGRWLKYIYVADLK